MRHSTAHSNDRSRFARSESSLRPRSTRQSKNRKLALESLENRCLLAIDVAVVGGNGDNSGFAAIVSQLNNDTYFDFNATLVTASAVDTVAELNSYKAVVIGNSGTTNGDPFDNAVFTSALKSWVQAGGGLVATGFLIYGAGTATGTPVPDIDAIVPVTTSGSYGFVGAGGVVNPVGVTHAVTVGVSAFGISGGDDAEYPATSPVVDSGATVLATVSGQPTVVAGPAGSGRSVYLGPIYAAASGTYNTAELRVGAPDRLLEQALHWVSDAIAPSVIATNPANLGTLNASSLSTMNVTFSEPVTASSAQNTANYLLKGPGGSIAITGAQLDGSGTTVAISFAKARPWASIAFKLIYLQNMTISHCADAR